MNNAENPAENFTRLGNVSSRVAVGIGRSVVDCRRKLCRRIGHAVYNRLVGAQ